jgi:hypothetical protein
MKTFIKKISIAFILMSSFACGSSDENKITGGGDTPSICIASSLAFTLTNLEDFPSTNSVTLSYSVKNNSSSAYNPETNASIKNVYYKVRVITKEGTSTDGTAPIPIDGLVPGATKTFSVFAKYAKNQTYDKYSIDFNCEAPK